MERRSHADWGACTATPDPPLGAGQQNVPFRAPVGGASPTLVRSLPTSTYKPDAPWAAPTPPPCVRCKKADTADSCLRDYSTSRRGGPYGPPRFLQNDYGLVRALPPVSLGPRRVTPLASWHTGFRFTVLRDALPERPGGTLQVPRPCAEGHLPHARPETGTEILRARECPVVPSPECRGAPGLHGSRGPWGDRRAGRIDRRQLGMGPDYR